MGRLRDQPQPVRPPSRCWHVRFGCVGGRACNGSPIMKCRTTYNACHTCREYDEQREGCHRASVLRVFQDTKCVINDVHDRPAPPARARCASGTSSRTAPCSWREPARRTRTTHPEGARARVYTAAPRRPRPRHRPTAAAGHRGMSASPSRRRGGGRSCGSRTRRFSLPSTKIPVCAVPHIAGARHTLLPHINEADSTGLHVRHTVQSMGDYMGDSQPVFRSAPKLLECAVFASICGGKHVQQGAPGNVPRSTHAPARVCECRALPRSTWQFPHPHARLQRWRDRWPRVFRGRHFL